MLVFTKDIRLILILFLFASCSKDEGPNETPISETRSFYMGFTAFPYDNSIEASLDTYDSVAGYLSKSLGSWCTLV